jgi:hypothetical protein
VLIGSSAHYIDNTMFQKPTILLEDAYMLSNLLIKEDDYKNAFDYFNSYCGTKVELINSNSLQYSKYFSSFKTIKIFKPFKIILMLFFKSFDIKRRFYLLFKNLNFIK